MSVSIALASAIVDEARAARSRPRPRTSPAPLANRSRNAKTESRGSDLSTGGVISSYLAGRPKVGGGGQGAKRLESGSTHAEGLPGSLQAGPGRRTAMPIVSLGIGHNVGLDHHGLPMEGTGGTCLPERYSFAGLKGIVSTSSGTSHTIGLDQYKSSFPRNAISRLGFRVRRTMIGP